MPGKLGETAASAAFDFLDDTRVGVEQGETPATLYGVALALVTWVYLAMVQPNVIFGAVLLVERRTT